MDERAARCTLHAVVVLCFGCWQGLANRSMRIQDLYVGPVPIPRFIKEYSYSLWDVRGFRDRDVRGFRDLVLGFICPLALYISFCR